MRPGTSTFFALTSSLALRKRGVCLFVGSEIPRAEGNRRLGLQRLLAVAASAGAAVHWRRCFCGVGALHKAYFVRAMNVFLSSSARVPFL